MVTTCYSPFGRNRAVGERIGRGEPLAAILAGMVNVAEGVPTTRSVHDLARRRGVEMPITDEVFRILFEGKSPRAAVTDLMVRAPEGRVAVDDRRPDPLCPRLCARRLQGVGRRLRRAGRRAASR